MIKITINDIDFHLYDDGTVGIESVNENSINVIDHVELEQILSISKNYLVRRGTTEVRSNKP